MHVRIKYLGKTMELFGLPPNQKEETIFLGEKPLYKDALDAIREKFLQANRNKDITEFDIFNDVAVFSKGRILRSIEEKPIDHPEIVIAPLIAGG